MESLLKRFGESGTASRPNLFRTARLKLTALYVLIVAVIIFGFSIFLYHSTLQNLADISDEDFSGVESRTRFVAQTEAATQHDIILADIIILLSAAGLSYFLAGRTLEPVQRALEAQRAFAAKASHELRTPLAILRNETEVVLRNDRLTVSEAKQTLESNVEEFQKLAGIVENLLMLARSDQGIAHAHTVVDLATLAKTVADKIRPLAEQKGTTVTFSGAPNAMLKGSAPDLERALLNLLQNSITHTSNGSIHVSCAVEGETIKLTIADTGSGIMAVDLPHVLKRFYTARSQVTEGTGLGLSIVDEVVRQHGGSVTLESEVGKGTRVLLRLPRG